MSLKPGPPRSRLLLPAGASPKAVQLPAGVYGKGFDPERKWDSALKDKWVQLIAELTESNRQKEDRPRCR